MFIKLTGIEMKQKNGFMEGHKPTGNRNPVWIDTDEIIMYEMTTGEHVDLGVPATFITLRAQVALMGEALNIMMDTFRCSPRNVDHEREADAYAKATAALAAPEVVAVREIRWCPTCNDIPHGLMVGTEECSICGDTVLKHSAVILKREGAAERNDTSGEGE